MVIMLDTSVMVAGFVSSHPKHIQALNWLKKAKKGEFTLAVSAHTVAACYAVLTKLPTSPQITPAISKLLIEENIEKSAQIIALSSSEYLSLMKDVANLGLSGGIIYDAIIVKAARKAKAQKILSFNLRDFHRLLPDQTDFVESP